MILNSLKNNKLFKNLSWIFCGNVIHAIFSFALSVIAARSFTTNDYGMLNYAMSLTALFSSLCTLGLNVIITKEITEKEKKAGQIIASGICLRIIAAVFSIIIMFIFWCIRGNKDSSFIIIFIYSLGIIFSALDLLIYWFRSNYKSNVSAVLKLIAFLISAVIKTVSILLNNIVIFAIGAIIETLSFGLLLIYKYVREKKWYLTPSVKLCKRLFKASIPFIFSSVLVAVYSQTDKIMLEAMVGYDSVAQYSVCYTLANVVAVVLYSLVEAFRPEILKARSYDSIRYEDLYKHIYGLIFWISALYGAFVCVFSKYILLILYGEKYLGAQTALSLIVWYSSFSYFGAIHNIYLVAENKTSWVQIMTLVGAITNIGVNFLLIPQMGAAGAALSSFLTQFIANFIFPFLIPKLRPMAYLSLKGIFSFRLFLKRIKT